MWPELRSTVLYPPPPQREYRCDGYGDYIFMVSRLTPLKRADLLVRALATPEAEGVRAVIAGDGEDRARLVELAREVGVSDRVAFTGVITEVQLIEHLARCRAVCFPPIDEDYGFVTAEAFASAKAVVTCRDSGGPVELVDDGVTGLVCDPSPDALGRALARMMNDRPLAETMGRAALQSAARLKWVDAVAALTAVD
jgi:glycosyltransferase involved in cell wall biosynthesis